MRAIPDKRDIPGCGHALSQHNELGYCRSLTTPDRSGNCVCDGTRKWERQSDGRSPR